VLGNAPWSPRERADRFAEFVELTDRLLRAPETSFSGRFYSADGARTYPGCVQDPRVPFAIAATGPRAMRVAARHGDTWVTTGVPQAETALPPTAGAVLVRRQMDSLDEACAAAGRDPASIGRLVLTGLRLESGMRSAAELDDTLARYAAVGVTDFVVHWPRADGPFAGDATAFEQVFSARLGA
jgi:alkanesulfonate monooxygenase SsuD/methylene tetrahydromethanopterin reductase-like flavin-dependent oxidoreductase (luciferase family)